MDQATYWISAVVVSALALLVSLATYLRTGDWKRTDAGKEVESKIGGLKERVQKVENQTEGLPARVELTGNRLTALETRLLDMATKADIAELSAEMDAVQDDVRLIRSATTRIEDHLLRMTK